MSNILITGGYGFIGSHVVDTFLNKGYSVTVIDNLNTGKLQNLQHLNPHNNPMLEVQVDDFANYKTLMAIRGGKYQYVLHLAANASVPFSVDKPVESNDNNVSKTLLLLDACKVGGIKKFVFSSSSAVYGDPKTFPTNELSTKNPMSPYALQKGIIEDYCKLYNELYGLQCVCLRYFNVFGPRQAGSGPYANVISSWCEKGIRNKQIRLDGEGKAYRDFVYVGDVAQSNLLAVTSNTKFGCYNIGSGTSIQIFELLKYFQTYFGNVEVVHAPTRIGDPLRTQADISVARAEIGFSPSPVTEDMFYNTFKWYKENVK
jgi:UDP-glucose 4-epimerase